MWQILTSLVSHALMSIGDIVIIWSLYLPQMQKLHCLFLCFSAGLLVRWQIAPVKATSWCELKSYLKKKCFNLHLTRQVMWLWIRETNLALSLWHTNAMWESVINFMSANSYPTKEKGIYYRPHSNTKHCKLFFNLTVSLSLLCNLMHVKGSSCPLSLSL